ncbi:BatD family protein [Shewanella sp. YIC-542]|uniref:BatD family protein n=1 Tax=Shewanella mytili TaxID=3377111 RepID=UPI00398ED26C
MVKLRFSLWLLLAAILPLKALALTELQSSVDKNPVVQGEYVALTVVADDDLSSQALDTSALLQHFVVGRTSVGRSTQIINFDTRKETRWQILISPKQAGDVEIPALEINGVKSNPIQLQVLKAGSVPQQMKNLFLQTSISSHEAYVGQLLTYKVKLYLAVDLQRGVLSTPNIEGAQIKQIGDDKDSSAIVNGRRYRVIERTYSIVADNPGELLISGVNFSGDVLMNAPSSGMFSFQESRPVQAQGDSTIVTIKPVPSQYVGNWLVADLVTLQEDWQDKPHYTAGQPITRNITLLAANADETSLPDFSLSLPPDIRSYPEKPLRKTYLRDGQTVAKLSQTIAMVPAKAGRYTLPEIKVGWWNPHLEKQQYATLPARHITVEAASNAPLPTINASAVQPHIDAGFWPYVSLALAALWLITLFLWLRAKKAAVGHLDAIPVPEPAATGVSLTAAIKQDHVPQVLTALLQEVSAITGSNTTLAQLSQVSAPLAAIARQLQAAHYGRTPADTGPLYLALQQALKQLRQQPGQHTTKASPLAPLNP